MLCVRLFEIQIQLEAVSQTTMFNEQNDIAVMLNEALTRVNDLVINH